ncbi:hypothetical protein NXS19_008311 [Fusarium pseudograminearum]|nr:hypothetical protein NXS19_008311 [Fusarium pseudograminearum]
MTTSTLYTTTCYTVTKCPPEVTDCPERPHVTTETVVIGTTVCPVTEEHPTDVETMPVYTDVPKPSKPVYTAPVEHQTTTHLTTSTIYTTKVTTVTMCPPDVVDCPERPHTRTETVVVGTTICPVTETHVVPVPPKQTHPVVQPPRRLTPSFSLPTLATAPTTLPSLSLPRRHTLSPFPSPASPSSLSTPRSPSTLKSLRSPSSLLPQGDQACCPASC